MIKKTLLLVLGLFCLTTSFVEGRGSGWTWDPDNNIWECTDPYPVDWEDYWQCSVEGSMSLSAVSWTPDYSVGGYDSVAPWGEAITAETSESPSDGEQYRDGVDQCDYAQIETDSVSVNDDGKSYVVDGVHSDSGSALDVTFTPAVAGDGNVTFTQDWSMESPCTASGTETEAGSYASVWITSLTIESACGESKTTDRTDTEVAKLWVPYVPDSIVTLTAEKFPDVWPEDKPTWSGNSEPEWEGSEENEFTPPEAGEYTFTATCGNDVTVDLGVVGVDLVIDDDRIAVGNSTTATLTVSPVPDEGTLSLSLSSESVHTVSVYGDGELILGGGGVDSISWDLDTESYPAAVTIEGDDPSAEVDDVVLSLAYSVSSCSTSTNASMTVVGVSEIIVESNECDDTGDEPVRMMLDHEAKFKAISDPQDGGSNIWPTDYPEWTQTAGGTAVGDILTVVGSSVGTDTIEVGCASGYSYTNLEIEVCDFDLDVKTKCKVCEAFKEQFTCESSFDGMTPIWEVTDVQKTESTGDDVKFYLNGSLVSAGATFTGNSIEASANGPGQEMSGAGSITIQVYDETMSGRIREFVVNMVAECSSCQGAGSSSAGPGGFDIGLGSGSGDEAEESVGSINIPVPNGNNEPSPDMSTPNNIGGGVKVINLHGPSSGKGQMSSSGISEDKPSFEVVRDDNGDMRQIKAPEALAEFEVIDEFKYQINMFRAENVGPAGTNGIYTTTGSPFVSYIVENPDASAAVYNKLKVSEVRDGEASVSEYSYDESGAGSISSFTTGNGARTVTTEIVVSGTVTNAIKTVKNGNDVVASKVISVYESFPWGTEMSERIVDPDSSSPLRTSWFYYADQVETGSYGKTSLMVSPNGNWTRYEYNADGSKSTEIHGLNDEPTNAPASDVRATYYDYTLHQDEITDWALGQARTVTEKIEDMVVGKTFYAYKLDAEGDRVEITERASSGDASLGDSDNIRSTRSYFSESHTNALFADKIKSAESADGRLSTYSYEYGSYTTNSNPALCTFTNVTNGTYMRTTLTHGTANNPEGIAYKTIRDISIADTFGRTIQSERYVYDGVDYEQRIAWSVNTLNSDGKVVKTQSSDGRVVENTWGCCGLESTTDSAGVETVLSYDSLKRNDITQKTVDGINDIMRVNVFDAEGRTVKSTTSAGGLALVTTNAYDLSGRVTKSVNQASLVTTYSYSADGLTRTTVSPGPVTNVTASYLDGRTKFTKRNGIVQQHYIYYVNDDGSQSTKIYTGPNGTNSVVWSTTTTDMLGRTIKTERPGFGGATNLSTYTYNGIGQMVKSATYSVSSTSTNLTVAPTIYAYNELGQHILRGLDVNGNGIVDLDGADRVSGSDSYYEQDDNDDWWMVSQSKVYAEESGSTVTTNSTQKTRLTGLSASITAETKSIDILNKETVSKTAINRGSKTVTQTTTYPAVSNDTVSVTVNGLLTSSTTKSGLEYTYSYDALERRVGVTDPRTGTSMTYYNDKGQVAYVEDAASNKTWYAYSPTTGRRSSITNELGKVTRYEYTPEGQLEKTWGDTVYPVAYEYDDFDRMIKMSTYRDGSEWSGVKWPTSAITADITEWQYDSATGLLTNKLYADGNGTAYEYSSDGKLNQRTWARGITTDYLYDSGSGSMTNISYSDSTPEISFTYDRLGRQKTVVDAQGVRTFAYNESLQLASETIVTDDTTNVITRSYDTLGRSTGFDLGSDYDVDYGYDNFGRFSSVQSVLSAATNVFNYSYLGDSDLIESMVSGSITNSKAYEPNRNLITNVKNASGYTTISEYNYTNDELGRRTQRIDGMSAGSTTNTFEYNNRSEVVSAALGVNDFDYVYDNIGNRTSTTNNSVTNDYTANSLNQYSDIDGTNLTYDLDGNLLSDGVSTYTWNGENRLVGVSNSTAVLSFSYDYMGRRFEKAVEGSETNTFIYDGWNLIQESNNSITNNYVWGLDLSQTLQGAGGVGGLLSVTEDDGSACFPAQDANGNITGYIDDAGNVEAVYVYDAFGGVLSSSGSKADDFKFRFSSKYLDETGLNYYGYRYYDSEIGRWLNSSGREILGTINQYLFSGNNLFADSEKVDNLVPLSTFSKELHDADSKHRRGKTACKLDRNPEAPIEVTLYPKNCTDPCVSAHEDEHVRDLMPCCKKAATAYQQKGANKQEVLRLWGAYMDGIEDATECNAYDAGVSCLQDMQDEKKCNICKNLYGCCKAIKKHLKTEVHNYALHCIRAESKPTPTCPF